MTISASPKQGSVPENPESVESVSSSDNEDPSSSEDTAQDTRDPKGHLARGHDCDCSNFHRQLSQRNAYCTFFFFFSSSSKF